MPNNYLSYKTIQKSRVAQCLAMRCTMDFIREFPGIVRYWREFTCNQNLIRSVLGKDIWATRGALYRFYQQYKKPAESSSAKTTSPAQYLTAATLHTLQVLMLKITTSKQCLFNKLNSFIKKRLSRGFSRVRLTIEQHFWRNGWRDAHCFRHCRVAIWVAIGYQADVMLLLRGTHPVLYTKIYEKQCPSGNQAYGHI